MKSTQILVHTCKLFIERSSLEMQLNDAHHSAIDIAHLSPEPSNSKFVH